MQAIEASGWAGPALFVALYVLSTVLLFPASVLTLIAGALYGKWLCMMRRCIVHGSRLHLPMRILLLRGSTPCSPFRVSMAFWLPNRA